MKKNILTTIAFLPAMAFAQNKFQLHAALSQRAPATKAYLIYKQDQRVVKDSAIINNGTFSFNGTLADPFVAQLVVDHQGAGLAKLDRSADFLVFYIDKGTTNLTAKDSVKNAVITGSKINEENKLYKAFLAKAEQEVAALNRAYTSAPEDKKQDQAFIDSLQSKADVLLITRKALQKQFIKEHPDAYVSLLALMEISNDGIEVQTIKPLFESLSENTRKSAAGKSFASLLNTAEATDINSTAPVFTSTDVNDKPVSLSEFRGKYVLLDFWASWCGPCRNENPNVVKAYRLYKDKNFTVLGVSLDRPGKKSDWLSAIKTDKLDWTQVSDLKFWENDVAKLYGVRAIPQNFLIDPNGKIIAKNLRGEELITKLSSLLN